jgi:2-amino-4-hydroxy-6-hydroxymethyldihydropteridine diphosphokinase
VRDLAFVALGSNVGDRDARLADARLALDALPRSRLLAVTAVEETTPVGPVPQGPYLNQMAAVLTELEPLALLDHLHAIERAAGRAREVRWGPRTLDLDIVAFTHQTVTHPRLTVPHPELPNRDWWQRELAELRARVAAPDAPAAEHA